MQKNQRVLWIDIVRFLAIFLVVYIHTMSVRITNAFFALPIDLFNIASIVCISFFFLISGWLLIPKHESGEQFFRKRVMRVFIPWVFWGLLWLFYEVFIFQTITPTTKMLYHTFLGAFWFVPILLGSYIATPILRIYLLRLSAVSLWSLVLAWFMVFILVPIVFFYQGIYITNIILTIFQFMGIYMVGFILSKTVLPKKYLIIWLLLFAISLVTIYLEYLFLPPEFTKRLSSYPYNIISPEFLLLGISGFLTVYTLCNNWYEKKLPSFVVNLITAISKASLGIYLVHEFIVMIYVKLGLPNNLPLEETIIVLSLSFAVSYLLSKIPGFSIISGVDVKKAKR